MSCLQVVRGYGTRRGLGCRVSGNVRGVVGSRGLAVVGASALA